MERVQLAREALIDFTSKYTQEHPLVQEQLAKVEGLEKMLNELTLSQKSNSEERSHRTLTPVSFEDRIRQFDLNERAPELESVRIKLQALENNRVVLANRQLEARLFAQNPPGYCRVFSPAALGNIEVDSRWPKVMFLTAAAMLLGLFVSMGTVVMTTLLRCYGVKDFWNRLSHYRPN